MLSFCFLALVLVATLPAPVRARRLLRVLSQSGSVNGVSSRERRFRLISACDDDGEGGPVRPLAPLPPPIFPFGEFGRERVFMVAGAASLHPAAEQQAAAVEVDAVGKPSPLSASIAATTSEGEEEEASA